MTNERFAEIKDILSLVLAYPNEDEWKSVAYEDEFGSLRYLFGPLRVNFSLRNISISAPCETFILNSRNYVSELIAEVERLRKLSNASATDDIN